MHLSGLSNCEGRVVDYRHGCRLAALAHMGEPHSLIEGSPVPLVVDAAVSCNPWTDYPVIDSYVLAGDWNAIARQNQRMEVRLRQ